MFSLLLLCDDDDFAIVTDEEEDDNFAIVVVFNVVLLTLPLLSPFCVNRVLFSFDGAIGVMLMVVTDNMLMFSCLFMRACVYFVFCCAVKFVFSVVLFAISSGPSRPPIFSLVKKL